MKTYLQYLKMPMLWHDTRHIEFMELSMLCENHPEIGEIELHRRYNYWGKQLRMQKKFTRAVTIILLILIMGLWSLRMVTTNVIAAVILFTAIIILRQHRRRKKVIKENLSHCYTWIYNEIIKPKKWPPANHNRETAEAFKRFIAKERIKERKRREQFRSFISTYGYTEETLHN